MRRLQGITAVTVLLLAALGAGAGARAQTPIRPLPPVQVPRLAARPPVPVQVSPDIVQVLKRSPLAFKAFQLQDFHDPKTGKVITANQMITLANGKTLSGAEFLAEANRLEQEAAKIGYTLRSRGEVEIQRTLIPTAKFKAQELQLQRLHPPPSALLNIRPWNLAQMEQVHATRLLAAPRLTQLFGQMAQQHEFHPFKTAKSDRYEYGSRSTFAAYFDYGLSADGEKDRMSIHANSSAGVYLFGEDEQLVSVTGDMVSPTRDSTVQPQADLVVTILGDDLITPIHEKGENGSLKKHGDESFYKIDESVEFPFMIGPIPCTVKVGCKGNAGVKYDILLAPLSVSASVSPYVDTKAYAQCGVDLLIVSAGAGAELTLLKDTLTLSADFNLNMDNAATGPVFNATFTGTNAIDALSGNVYVYASVDLLLWSDSWKWDLFSWDGLHDDGYLFEPVNYSANVFSGEVAQKKNLQVTIWDAAITCSDKGQNRKQSGAVMRCRTDIWEAETNKVTSQTYNVQSDLPSVSPLWETEMPMTGTKPVRIHVMIERLLPAGGHTTGFGVLNFDATYDPQTKSLSGGVTGPADKRQYYEGACGWMHVSARER
jgi:hypothetical protein